jgi:hypothetical protein
MTLLPSLGRFASTIFAVGPLACLGSGLCCGGTTAFSFSSSGPQLFIPGGSYSYGFQFTTLTDIAVDSLGYLDNGQDGLAASHEVGIWNSAGTLLFSTSLSTGTLAGPVLANSQFSYSAITPLFLAAGDTYTIGAESDPSDNWIYDPSGTQTSSAPSLLTVSSGGFYITSGGFAEPTNTFGNHYDIVNFTAVEAGSATPEPSSLGLAVVGLGGVLLAVFRKRGGLPQLR